MIIEPNIERPKKALLTVGEAAAWLYGENTDSTRKKVDRLIKDRLIICARRRRNAKGADRFVKATSLVEYAA